MATSLPFLIAALAQHHFLFFDTVRVATRFRPAPHVAPRAPVPVQLQASRGNDASVQVSGVPIQVDPSIQEAWKPHIQANWKDGAKGESHMAPTDTDADRNQLFLQAKLVLALRARIRSQKTYGENPELTRQKVSMKIDPNVRTLLNKRVPKAAVIRASIQAPRSRRAVMMGKEAAERNLASVLGHVSGQASGTGSRAALKAALKQVRAGRAVMISKEDSESNERLVAALWADDPQDKMDLQRDTSVSSHLKLDEDNTMLRFVHVDEQDCIGCTYCASVARSTFFMEDYAGRARVFSQGTDNPEIVQEAIDCCPVNCISYVDLEDLTILESERDGLFGEESLQINQRSIGVGGDSFTNRRAPSRAKGSNLMTCTNCPSKGCKDCPMYGVGQNPVYIARLKERAAKKAESGEAAREAFAAEADQKVSDLYDGAISRETEAEEKPDGGELEACFIDLESEECLEAMDAIFAEGYEVQEPTLPEDPL